ncbi:MAG: flagellar export chaperone FliS [Myxococcales bacterium]|nr:flagellar export chaperone FliS [Myxococcales bacterium]
MFNALGARRYKQVGVETASPGQLLLALYSTAIRYARKAAQSIRNGDVVAKGTELQRVSAIVGELASTLDHAVAPELCGRLEQLYFYMQERLTYANVALDADAAEEVANLLTTLHEGWTEAVAEAERERPAKGPAARLAAAAAAAGR